MFRDFYFHDELLKYKSFHPLFHNKGDIYV